MPPHARPAGCDWLAVWAACAAAGAAGAVAAMSALRYPPLDAALGAIGRVENGPAGGTAAGLVAIAPYTCGRRLRSRERKFRLADMLCIEMVGMRDAMPDYSPDASISRFRTSVQDPPPRAGAPTGGAHASRRPAPGRLPPSSHGMACTGLLIPGNLSRFEPALQARLHALYGRIGQGGHAAAGPMLRPMLREVAAFRDANAAFRLQDLARPLPLALSIPRRLRGRMPGRRGRPTRG